MAYLGATPLPNPPRSTGMRPVGHRPVGPRSGSPRPGAPRPGQHQPTVETTSTNEVVGLCKQLLEELRHSREEIKKQADEIK